MIRGEGRKERRERKKHNIRQSKTNEKEEERVKRRIERKNKMLQRRKKEMKKQLRIPWLLSAPFIYLMILCSCFHLFKLDGENERKCLTRDFAPRKRDKMFNRDRKFLLLSQNRFWINFSNFKTDFIILQNFSKSITKSKINFLLNIFADKIHNINCSHGTLLL